VLQSVAVSCSVLQCVKCVVVLLVGRYHLWCVYVYACICVYFRVCVRARVLVCVRVTGCVCIYVHVYICARVYINIYTCVSAFLTPLPRVHMGRCKTEKKKGYCCSVLQ